MNFDLNFKKCIAELRTVVISICMWPGRDKPSHRQKKMAHRGFALLVGRGRCQLALDSIFSRSFSAAISAFISVIISANSLSHSSSL